ncbi:MAG TPA: tetratricopeptide repeat protein [Polyangiaceae bacterium]|nr:tetratricopeptide repeat protein [Polyangiaceae bacterium]
MDSQTIRTALGTLQAIPDSNEAWTALRDAVKASGGDLSTDELLRLLDAARDKHESRGEWAAVAGILDIASQATENTPREAEALSAQAKVLGVEMFDDDGAAVCYLRLLEIDPGNSVALSAIAESESKRQRFSELATTYAGEAEQASDDVYKSSMLMRAAEMEVRYGGQSVSLETAIERLEQAVRLDASNERAGRLLEHIYRSSSRWEELARVLERLADRSEKPASRVAAGVRLARLFAQHLSDNERAARAYDRVLRVDVSHAEAKAFLSEFYGNDERWADLVALYERELKVKDTNDSERLGDMLQIAMLHWRKLSRPQDAEPWFERIRKVEPNNEGMLNFCREYYGSLQDDTRLIDVLQGAQRSVPDGSSERKKLASEIAKLAEGTANAQKAIEQYKSILRQDPDSTDARDSLKRLYKQTQGYNALVELLRQQLERTPPEQYQERLAILREVATVYRQYVRSDTALLSVLNQIVQLDDKLDEHDADEMRELVGLYDKLGRHRDLITHQLKLAEITPDIEEKKELYRAAARRWLEQFSNAQNATDAYAALLKIAPTDVEAHERLEDLYRKRRAWDKLFELYSSDLLTAEGGAKLSLLKELAQLAAERLNRGAEAVELYKRILEIDPGRAEVLDALEKYAERAKDWPTLAEVLERRVAALQDDAAKLTALQKLGTVYAEHIADHQQAARAWQRVLELSPGHSRALRVLRETYLQGADYEGLERLYASQNDWDGLAEVLSTAADRAKDVAQRIDLSYRAAAVYEQKLNQPERAFRSYDRILTADPTDTRAARALIPLYEQDEKWARLPALYELLLERAEGEADQLALLGKLVEVSGKRLNDRKAAALYARKAYELSPSSSAALDLLEESSRAAGTWETFVEAVEQRLGMQETTATPPAVASAEPAPQAAKKGKKKKKGDSPAEPVAVPAGSVPGTERRLLELRLARVFAEELGRSEQAIATYKQMLERDPADAEVAAAMEAILRREDRRDDLRWLLELRVEHAADDDTRARILSDWATLEEDVFESPERAITIYRRILAVHDSDPAALSTLPRLLLAQGNAAGAVEIIEQHRQKLSGDERAEREVELAEHYQNLLGRPEDAFKNAVYAVDSASVKARAMAVLERLLDVPQVRARVAEVLASQYAASGEARREAHALNVLLTETQDASARLPLYLRLADAQQHKLVSYGSALDVVLEAVRKYPSELTLWDRADELAQLAGRPTDLGEAFREVMRGSLPEALEVELSERAARLHEDRLGDPIGATPYLERVLTLSPGNEAAFQRLKDILTAAERWSELEALYDRASSATDDLARRAEMLVEVALICEEIIEDAEKATRYYERILEVDPLHDVSVRALDRLYVRQGKDQKLAALLEKRLETAAGDEAFELKLRLAKLSLDLHQPEKSMLLVEDVLGERINDFQARELTERMLEIGSLRQRAARLLETVYLARDEIRDLVRVLEVRLEGFGSDPANEERRELLRRIATLRDDRLHDDESALRTLSLLVPADPLDVDARKRLLEIGRRLGLNERVAEVLTEAAERASSLSLRGEILMQVASICEELLGDRARAERVYRRVLVLDEADAELVLPAARALERIYIASSEPAKLAEMLRIQVKLEQAAQLRAELFGRIGELCQNVLGDNDGAIAAWKARVEENPDDEQALAALDRLYELTERYRDLVSVLERRREISPDAELRRALMKRTAETLWKKLEAVPEAIEAYQALINEFGPNGASLSALEALFGSASHWDELSETLERHLDVAESDSERLELFAKLGDLKREHLSDVSGSLAVYRRALALDTRHAPSRVALERLLDAEEPVPRREAAQILHPIYESEADYERLLRVLEIEVLTSDDPLERIAGLEAAMRTAETSLHDSKRAFGYAERAVRSAVGHSQLEPWFDHLERLSAATGKQAEYVKLLCEVVPEIFDGEVQLEVTLKIADLARHQLADRELAREYYKKALEQRVDDKKALSALESLYEETGDAQNLLEILERRAEVAESDDERKQLLFRRARLLSDVLDNKKRAIEVYESILEFGLDPAAVSALETLYGAVSSWPELIALYERQLHGKIGNAADLRVAIAKVAAHQQRDLGRAFDELETALSADRQHAGVISELERILAEAQEPEHRARAAALLEPVYLSRSDFGRVMDAIRARLSYASDPDERHDLLLRLAKLYEEQKEDYRAALDTIAELLKDDLSDSATISELERLSKVAGAERRLAEIYATELEKVSGDDGSTVKLARRTGELFTTLGELPRALVFYRRALAFEPESRELFAAIDEILLRTARHEERVALYREALDHRFDAKERLAALHTMAGLQKAELGRPDDAIETYRAVLDVDDSDSRALDALTELYRERERWDDLAELYLRRAEAAEEPARGAVHRLALARLYIKRGETDRAVDQLEEIVNRVPAHPEAIAELEALRKTEDQRQRVVDILRPIYESLDDWRRQITLNEDRFALADGSEKVAVLRETAELWERRGGDLSRARRAYEAAFMLDPEDSDARADYERLTEATSEWDKLAETYDAVLREHGQLNSKRELLSTLARVHNEKRDDPRRALAAYGLIHESDSSDLEPLEKMEQLATLLSDWPTLVRVLTDKADLLLDDGERASVWRRVGEAKRDMLDDAEGAIVAYERALELDPQSAFTVDCLTELYEAKHDAKRLVELYVQRVELSTEDDADLKYTLLVSAAALYERDLSDRTRAIEVLGQALAVRPGDPGVLATLNRLYRIESMWPELLDNLRFEASAASAPEERARLRKEIGSILASKLENFDDALEAQRLALEDVPTDLESVAAVRVIGESHEDLRQTVAEILVPVLRRTESWQELVSILEMRLTVETEPSQRMQTLREIAEALETKLGKQSSAEEALLRALSERPEEPELHAEIERLAQATGGWARYADTLGERAQSMFEPEVAQDLFVRLGRVAEEQLKNDQRAVEAYCRAVEQAGDRPELLVALDRLYSRLGEKEKVAEILERRVTVESSEQVQADLYFRLAQLQIDSFKEPARGLSSLRLALDRAQDHEAAVDELEKLTTQHDLFEEAAEVLESVYRGRGRTDRLAKLYEKRVGHADSLEERVDMRRSLSRVLEDECKDPAAAQRVLEQGLLEVPTDGALLDELERLAGITGDWQGSAGALSQAIDQHTDLSAEAAVALCVRLASWQKDHVASPSAAEAALNRALGFEPESDDVLLLIEALQRVPGRERDLCATLRRRAKLQLDEDRREELYRQAQALAVALGDSELVESVLRELLGQDDANLWALAELTRVSEANGNFQETFELLVKRSELGADAATVRSLRRQAAEIARDKLNLPAKAILLYEQLFEDEPNDSDASGALRALYARASRFDDLGRLLERLIDMAESPAARSVLRMELAKLNEERFQALDTAIELLRAVLDDEPGRADAVVALSELYEKTKRDEDLADLLSAQISGAQERGDLAGELSFQVRLGEVYDSRLGDRERAIETYRAVLERDAKHSGALEALARLLQSENRLPEAAQVLDQLLLASTGEAAVARSLELAAVQQKLGSPEEATLALERGLVHDERSSDLRARLRSLYESMQAWEKLAALLTRDADFATSPEESVALLRKAAAIHAEQRADHGSAADALDRASKLRPDDRELLLALCDEYSASGRGKAAQDVLLKIVDSYGSKRPKELGEIHRRLAKAYLADGENQKAMDELDKAFRIEPGNVNVLTLLGQVAFDIGDYKKAQQMFRALLLQKLDESGPLKKSEVFLRLGEVHEKVGEAPKAIQMYERAIQTDGLQAAKDRLAALKGK